MKKTFTFMKGKNELAFADYYIEFDEELDRYIIYAKVKDDIYRLSADYVELPSKDFVAVHFNQETFSLVAPLFANRILVITNETQTYKMKLLNEGHYAEVSTIIAKVEPKEKR